MNLQKLRIQRRPGLMIIPMIDIIFFLLVFFMLSTLYMSEQKGLPMQLPQATAGEVVPENIVAISVLADGAILLDGQAVDKAMFSSCIAAAQQEAAEVPLFVVRSDANTAYGNVVFVLDQLKAAGVRRIAFATAERAE